MRGGLVSGEGLSVRVWLGCSWVDESGSGDGAPADIATFSPSATIYGQQLHVASDNDARSAILVAEMEAKSGL